MIEHGARSLDAAEAELLRRRRRRSIDKADATRRT
jgi:hypothetical protein